MIKILVIESNKELLEGIVEGFILEGYETFGTQNGLEAVQLALQHQPNFIISDITVEGLDTHDIFSQLKRKPETAKIPYLLLVAWQDYHKLKHKIFSGVNIYMRIPLDMSELLKSVNARLRQGRINLDP